MKKALYFLGTAFFCHACVYDDVYDLDSYRNRVITYFQEVALGFEYGSFPEVTRKWGAEMKIFIGGNPGPELTQELQSVVGEINSLVTDGFQLSITRDSSESNCYMYFGGPEKFALMFPFSATALRNSYGLFYCYFDSTNYLDKAVIYVDIFRAQGLSRKKHILREELTQSLGLAKDSPRYKDSIFQARSSSTTSYATIDKDLIRLLYHPRMTPGLTRETSKPLLAQLAKELGIGR